MTLVEDLRRLDCGDVDDSLETRTRFSHDASIFEVQPQVVVSPRDERDVERIVAYAAMHPGVALTPRSAGTDMSGGAVGQSIVIDMLKHCNHIVNIERDTSITGRDGRLVVQPGALYRDVEPETMSRNLLYPVYPASRDICAMGGIVSNNSGGEKSLTYGQAVHWVERVRAVVSDGHVYEFGPLTRSELEEKMKLATFEGQLYRSVFGLLNAHRDEIEQMRPRVSKNSSGYQLWHVWDGATFNLAKLFCGAQGTLGVVTQATVGLMTPKPYKQMIVLFLDDVGAIADVVNDILTFQPETVESFDDKTLWFTLRFLPDFVRILGASNIVSLGLRFLPEAWMVIRGGLPKLIVIAEFVGDDAQDVQTRSQKALQAVHARGIRARRTKDEQESHKYWTIRRSSFNVIRSHTKGKKTTPFIDDFIVRPADMPAFLPKLYEILRPYRLTLTIAGHIGDGNFHIIPLMDLRDPSVRTIIPELSKKVYDLVLSYHGSITAEHNDGLIRGPYIRQQFGDRGYEIFRQVKHLFDPKGIFNPGRKIDVDWEWAIQHLRTD